MNHRNMDVNNEEHTKRKRATPTQASDFEDDFYDDSTSAQNDDEKKNIHSEIEKRRRDKINSYITELASIVPKGRASRKVDKLSVLKMTVQHMKSIRGAVNSDKHSFLIDRDLKNLITQVADGFVFVVSCDRGKIIYVSKSVTQVLSYSPGDLIGSNVFDYVHSKDLANVKEQLYYTSEYWLRDSNTKEAPPQMCSGARRSFMCRIKRKEQFSDKNAADTTTGSKSTQSDSQYIVIKCTGYIKPCAQTTKFDDPSTSNLHVEDNNVGTSSSSSSTNKVVCLVATGRIVDTSSSVSASSLSNAVGPTQFTSKFTIEGKFMSVDQNIAYIAGYLPQDLIGTRIYDYFHPEDVPRLIDIHNAVLQECNPKDTETYKFRTKDNNYIHLRSDWKSFRNPWTNKIDFITAKNNLVGPNQHSNNKPGCSLQDLQSQGNDDIFIDQHLFETQYPQSSIGPIENPIELHLEACKIGKYVATSIAIDGNKEVFVIESTPSLTQYDLAEEASTEDCLHGSLNSTMALFNEPCTSSCSRAGATYASSSYAASAYSAAQDNANLPSTASTPSTPSTASTYGRDSGAAAGDLYQPDILTGHSTEDALSDMMPSTTQHWSSTEIIDELYMSVIMNVPEAVTEIDRPIKDSGFEWSLP